jgi:hypothetical protein
MDQLGIAMTWMWKAERELARSEQRKLAHDAAIETPRPALRRDPTRRVSWGRLVRLTTSETERTCRKDAWTH